MSNNRLQTLAFFIASFQAFLLGPGSPSAVSQPGRSQADPVPLFQPADQCMACHNLLTAPSGEDISIGLDWRSSMMANSARDPYWQAAVRRESLDHPEARQAIENECSICHMPMATYEARVRGGMGAVFVHLPVGEKAAVADLLAADGVSCTVCHQITEENLGEKESFVGHFVIDASTPWGQRRVFGPFEIDKGRTTIMQSASRFRPAKGDHIQSSELCATCHTLITEALGPGGEPVGRLPEQVPYQEWLHSDYRNERSCQSCHMPEVDGETPIASVWGLPRARFSRHSFRGGNFFMARVLNRYRTDLGVRAHPQELSASVARTLEHLQSETARISLKRAEISNGRLEAEVVIENLAGHKLPTAYPSRRVWLHFSVRDGRDQLVFDSGAFEPTGRIKGNDNDRDPKAYEPHYDRIEKEEQVQIYEPILADREGRVTTGLLRGVRYAKDNRLLPRGFNKTSAGEDIAVRGRARQDEDFAGGGDQTRYSIPLQGAQGPFRVEVELWYQPIGFRWAENLRDYDAALTRRFVSYYEALSSASAVALVRAAETIH